jgi:nitrate/nitrite transporter NarK
MFNGLIRKSKRQYPCDLADSFLIYSNIVALLAGMCMRAIVGPCCDRYGPRKTSESEPLFGRKIVA